MRGMTSPSGRVWSAPSLSCLARFSGLTQPGFSHTENKSGRPQNRIRLSNEGLKPLLVSPLKRAKEKLGDIH